MVGMILGAEEAWCRAPGGKTSAGRKLALALARSWDVFILVLGCKHPNLPSNHAYINKVFFRVISGVYVRFALEDLTLELLPAAWERIMLQPLRKKTVVKY